MRVTDRPGWRSRFALRWVVGAQGCIGATLVRRSEKQNANMTGDLHLAATVAAPALADEAPKKGSDADDAFGTDPETRRDVRRGVRLFQRSGSTQVGEAAIDLARSEQRIPDWKVVFIYSVLIRLRESGMTRPQNCAQAIVDFRRRSQNWGGETSPKPDDARGCLDVRDCLVVRRQRDSAAGSPVRLFQRFGRPSGGCST